MRIILANPRGFCAGVEMAILTVERALELIGRPIYVYHEIVHNFHVVQALKRQGAVFVDKVEHVPQGETLIFSAHGVSPLVRQQAKSRHLRVIDATCPLVAKVHAEARSFAREGYHIVLIGHADHDEIVGTLGEAPDSMSVVASVEEAQLIDLPPNMPLAYLTQTTLSVDDANEIIRHLQARFPRLVGPAKDDICYATQNRQDAVRRLAPNADVVLVVGSNNSSNSNRLREVAEGCNASAYLVEDDAAMQRSWFRGGEVVVVTAGASAPERAVERVVSQLCEWFAAEIIEEAELPERTAFPLPVELRQLSNVMA